jgi:hypothetical protein
MDKPNLHFWWESRDPAQADDAGRLSRFVTGLPDFDPIYRSWLKSPITKEVTVPVPLSKAEAEQLLIDRMARSDFSDAPLPGYGSDIWGGHAGPFPYDFRESSYADTSCRVGAFEPPGLNPNLNHIFMRLSSRRSSLGRPWRASEVRPLMKFAREIWGPAEMCVRFPFHDLPMTLSPIAPAYNVPLRPRIGWITFLPANLAARAKYPGDVEVESFEDRAALVTLCEEPFGKGDAKGMARLHALEAALRTLQN